ncbi:hypothetical protein WICPIJ_001263 [Wickerhamomyces pijperi]|uniref:DNA primase n=1 Tax=Wickerhamomyces pijperi TaxID=599730 RepID=A0A9P8TRF0_WICPI|nr:hypothetical protein WICPIJ_001263 [Wickerhamomyces pijperi]
MTSSESQEKSQEPTTVPSSSTSEASQPQDVQPKAKVSSSDMEFYYKNLLPFRYVFQWLNHSPKPSTDFTMREFAYEFQSGAYRRYNSFDSLEDFKESIVKNNPSRFEVGAVYEINPRDRKSVPKSKMKPMEKELAFDIDLTDYDDVRTCCSKTAICTKCWKFITIATKIMDVALREDFGFEHIIWVFSGRRGAHCWVSDKRARQLNESQRRSVIEYMDVLKNKGTKRLNLRRPFHPHVQRSIDLLKAEFLDIILNEQDPWADDQAAFTALLKFPLEPLNKKLKEYWIENPGRSSLDKWSDINKICTDLSLQKYDLLAVNETKEELILEATYPRLDVEVTRQMNHLLKSPFCIHPGTGNVCVPFDSKNVFDPTKAPNLHQLQNEIIGWKGDNEVNDINRTSLKPYVESFGKYVTNLLKSEKNGKREREDESLEF